MIKLIVSGMTTILPAFLEPYKSELLYIVFFVDGLLFGLAIRKGATAFVLVIVAVAIAGFAGITFVPAISISSIWNDIYSYITTVHLGEIVFSGMVIAFVVGLVLGLLKK